MNSVNFTEIFIVNGIGIVLMVFLSLTRIEVQEENQFGEKLFDANDFKQINDMYGHSRGDDAIRRIGRILSDSVPENGIAVRYAGDEFIILLRTEEEKMVESVMKRVEQNTERFNQSSLEPFPLFLAMGYSRFDTESGNIEGFLSAMDREMYVSKQHHYQQAGADRRKRRAEGG